MDAVQESGYIVVEKVRKPVDKDYIRLAAGVIGAACACFMLLAIILLWTCAVPVEVNALNNNIVGGRRYLPTGEANVAIVATLAFALAVASNGAGAYFFLRNKKRTFVVFAALAALDLFALITAIVAASSFEYAVTWYFSLFVIPLLFGGALKVYNALRFKEGRDERLALKSRNKIKDAKTDYVYYAICGIILALLAIIVIYPLYYIVIASISDPDAVMTGEVWILPIKITFSGYARLFERSDIWSSYGNTLIYTVAGTVFNVVLTIPAGWALSRDYLPCRKVIMILLIITMFFGGGLIPYLIICEALGLVENPLIFVIGGGVSVYNVFMCKSFFETNVPQEVLEAGQIDGCGEIRTFFDLVLPISKSIISVMILFYAVGHWNSYIDSYIFMIDKQYWPLQTVLNEILNVTASGAGETILEQMRIATQIKYTSIIVATLPILILYPFVEKYFGQGVLVGSFK